MLEAAFRYPTTGEGALERLLVGGVLVVLSVFVLPIFVVYGYLVRSLAAVAAGEEEPPPFDGWAALFVDGLEAFVVVAVYAIVPFALTLAFLVPVSVGTGVGGEGSSGILAGLGALAFVVAVPVALAVAFVVMAALSNFAVEGRLGAAFDPGAVGRLATSGPYVVAVLLAIVVQLLVATAVLVAVVFTFGLALLVLIPLGAFIQFWLYLATVHLFGTAYREAMGGAGGTGEAAETGA